MKRTIDLKLVKSVEDGLTKAEREARLKILNAMIDAGGPLDISTLSEELQGFIEPLTTKSKIVIDDGRILFAYPISGLETAHNIKLADGRTFWSMCAIDSLGSTFTFHQDVEIDSICSQTGEKVHLVISNGRIIEHYPEEIHAIHVNLEEHAEWASSC